MTSFPIILSLVEEMNLLSRSFFVVLLAYTYGQADSHSEQLKGIVDYITLRPIPLIPPSMMGYVSAPFRVPGSSEYSHVGIQRAFVRRAIEFGINEPDILIALLSTFCSSNPFIGSPSVDVRQELSSTLPHLA